MLVLINFQTLEHNVLTCFKVGLVNRIGYYRTAKCICGNCISVWVKVPVGGDETTHLRLSFCLFLFMSKAVPGDDSSSFVAGFSNRCCFRQPRDVFQRTESSLTLTHTFTFTFASCQIPIWNYRMYFHVSANVSISACFPQQSCDVSEDLVCSQLSAL